MYRNCGLNKLLFRLFPLFTGYRKRKKLKLAQQIKTVRRCRWRRLLSAFSLAIFVGCIFNTFHYEVFLLLLLMLALVISQGLAAGLPTGWTAQHSESEIFYIVYRLAFDWAEHGNGTSRACRLSAFLKLLQHVRWGWLGPRLCWSMHCTLVESQSRESSLSPYPCLLKFMQNQSLIFDKVMRFKRDYTAHNQLENANSSC